MLLNANVAFLAVPSVDPATAHYNATQITSYISVRTSIGSILTGVLLIRQYRDKGESAEEAVYWGSCYMHRLQLNQAVTGQVFEKQYSPY